MTQCFFMGSKKLGLDCLTMLLESFPGTVCAAVTVDDRHEARSVYQALVALAERKSLPLIVLPPGGDLWSCLEAYNPDLVFVCGWYRVIEPGLLSKPRHGFVGVHNSLLPRYRGGAPVVWAMIQGETETGFSIFQLNHGLDDGPLFAQQAVPIHDDDTVAEVLARLEAAVPAALARIYMPMLNGSLTPSPQTGTPSYAAQRRAEDGLINWSLPQARVYDFIRAQSAPYPGAYTRVEEARIVIQRARKIDVTYYGAPGQVVSLGDDVLVVCGDNRPLKIDEIWLSGQTIPPNSVFNSLKLRLNHGSSAGGR